MFKFSFMTLSLIGFVIGLFMIFNSVSWGIEAANKYLQSLGGGMDTSQFMIILQEYINMYRWSGSILSGIGGLGLVKTIEFKQRS